MWFNTQQGKFLSTPISPNSNCLSILIEEEYLWKRFSIVFDGDVTYFDVKVHGDFAESIEANIIRRKIISF